jgi:hypothetical protein
MSVSLNPGNSLGFKRPLTALVKRSLNVTNHNAQPVAFKVKTTAPKLYCVRPNSGRVEPGETVEVTVMLQGMKEEPPLTAKCRDKFLIQSTLITPEKETMSLHDIWAGPDSGAESKIYEQKLRVTYLPPDDGLMEEEEDLQPNASGMSMGDSRFETVRPYENGHVDPIPSTFLAEQPALGNEYSVAREHPSVNVVEHEPTRDPTPPAQRDPGSERAQPTAFVPVSTQPAVQPSAPAPAPTVIVKENPVNEELAVKLNSAMAEIERLRAALATASVAPPSEVRQRRKALSDDGSVAETDVTTVDEGQYQQEGVPLQVVVIIALGVFITTYLFF